MLSEPPLVGRDEELARLNAVLQSTIGGTRRLVLISGEAGVGKTRLVMEFEKKVRALGAKTLIGGCLPSARINYLPLLDAPIDRFEEQPEKRVGSRTSRFLGSAKRAAPEMLEAVPVLDGILKGSAVLVKEYQGKKEEAQMEIDRARVVFRAYGNEWKAQQLG